MGCWRNGGSARCGRDGNERDECIHLSGLGAREVKLRGNESVVLCR